MIGVGPFVIGDVVALKSGGHPMTVISTHGESVEVAWSTKEALRRVSLPVRALKIAEKPLSLAELVEKSIKTDSSERTVDAEDTNTSDDKEDKL